MKKSKANVTEPESEERKGNCSICGVEALMEAEKTGLGLENKWCVCDKCLKEKGENLIICHYCYRMVEPTEEEKKSGRCKGLVFVKERILLMAKKLEEDLTLKDTICEQICNDLHDVTSDRWVRKCLPEEYKQLKRKKESEQYSGSSSADDNKKVPEQKAMTVNTEGYEESFEDIDRKDTVPASEIVEKLKKKLADVTTERDNLSNENKIIIEKTQPELLHEVKEMFYDKPGMLDAKQLQKISEKAGRDLDTIISRYNTIIKGAIEKGEPVPIGVYIMTKPDMKLVPIRIFIDFDRRSIKLSLWEIKLQSLNN